MSKVPLNFSGFLSNSTRVCWITIPIAFFLAANAENMVALLYGPQWISVANLSR